jgi:prepilin-type N-terminal cleavage/methylation domain-containing protein
MKRLKGFTMVEILVVVGIIALLFSLGIPQLLRARMSANEAAARGCLKNISTALETYALANGQFPADTATLIGQTPPYLTVDYFTGVHSGYTYTAALAGYTYSVVAAPINTSMGLTTFTMSTGGLLTSAP